MGLNLLARNTSTPALGGLGNSFGLLLHTFVVHMGMCGDLGNTQVRFVGCRFRISGVAPLVDTSHRFFFFFSFFLSFWPFSLKVNLWKFNETKHDRHAATYFRYYRCDGVEDHEESMSTTYLGIFNSPMP